MCLHIIEEVFAQRSRHVCERLSDGAEFRSRIHRFRGARASCCADCFSRDSMRAGSCLLSCTPSSCGLEKTNAVKMPADTIVKANLFMSFAPPCGQAQCRVYQNWRGTGNILRTKSAACPIRTRRLAWRARRPSNGIDESKTACTSSGVDSDPGRVQLPCRSSQTAHGSRARAVQGAGLRAVDRLGFARPRK